MKKLLLISGFISLAYNVFSQQGLKYSQTITLSGSTTNCSGSISSCNTIATVPAGKTWKIESAWINNDLNEGYLIINNNLAGKFDLTSVGIERPNFPIWLKSGDTIKFSISYFNVSTISYFLSILEFDIN